MSVPHAFRAATADTLGDLGPADVVTDAYADLSGAGHLDNSGSDDLLTRDQLDARFAPLSHTPSTHNHSTVDITSGTLDPARYDAYTDLGVSGRLDNNAADDVLIRSQLDARFAALSHSPAAHSHGISDVSSGTQTDNLSIPGNAFDHNGFASGYYRNDNGFFFTGDTSAYGYAPVYLPDGATITAVRGFYFDNTAASATFGCLLRGRNTGAVATFEIGNASVASAGASSTVTTTFTDTSMINNVVTNDSRQYFMRASIINANGNGEFKHYGCQVEYTWTTLTN